MASRFRAGGLTPFLVPGKADFTRSGVSPTCWPPDPSEWDRTGWVVVLAISILRRGFSLPLFSLPLRFACGRGAMVAGASCKNLTPIDHPASATSQPVRRAFASATPQCDEHLPDRTSHSDHTRRSQEVGFKKSLSKSTPMRQSWRPEQ